MSCEVSCRVSVVCLSRVAWLVFLVHETRETILVQHLCASHVTHVLVVSYLVRHRMGQTQVWCVSDISVGLVPAVLCV